MWEGAPEWEQGVGPSTASGNSWAVALQASCHVLLSPTGSCPGIEHNHQTWSRQPQGVLPSAVLGGQAGRGCGLRMPGSVRPGLAGPCLLSCSPKARVVALWSSLKCPGLLSPGTWATGLSSTP